jgi:putative salt-induced outer membrane protein YdiY
MPGFPAFRALRTLSVSAALLVVAGAGLSPARGADAPPAEPPPPPPPLANSTELSLVMTSGNAESTSYGFKDKFVATWWPKSSLEINAAAIRVESTTKTFDPTTGEEHDDTDTSASSKMLNARYNHRISDHFFWFAGAGWDRNRFSGINSRYTAFAGVGNIWVDREDLKFRTDYAASWTRQEDFPDNPNVDDSYAGLRLSDALLWKLGANTVFTNETIVNENVDETSDFRVDMTNALAVNMNKHLALKVSLQWLYDNEPAALVLSPTDEVLVEADDLDSIFTASLVVNF